MKWGPNFARSIEGEAEGTETVIIESRNAIDMVQFGRCYQGDRFRQLCDVQSTTEDYGQNCTTRIQ
jgi:hypothetical protein